MKKIMFAAVAAAGLMGSANAAVVTLQSISANGQNDNSFNYQATLGGDEGLRSGDRVIVYDFAGYISGSIFTPNANFVGTTELTSAALGTPGFTDDASLTNLVFTYVGTNLRVSGGPLAPLDINGLGARSTLAGTTLDGFFSQTVKNNPVGLPGGAGTPVYSFGMVGVPAAAVPEPAAWAMMLGGFGLIGGAMRRRAGATRVLA